MFIINLSNYDQKEVARLCRQNTMKSFNDSNFILETVTAQHLYHDYASKMPLCDYHCHLNPREIYEDRRLNNIVEVWLGGQNPDGSYAGDHYKWRMMRSHGIEESYISGNKPPYERFLKLTEALEMAIGNPMYHWNGMTRSLPIPPSRPSSVPPTVLTRL